MITNALKQLQYIRVKMLAIFHLIELSNMSLLLMKFKTDNIVFSITTIKQMPGFTSNVNEDNGPIC